ncbi:hypothetical protein LWI28_000854 [Acer negundo]|uniref:Uncharacterized protein n=1 Tax=Acer negundo TaxID=4023 RepID=A0AAD5J2M4_ACENE|nr:hypothetical protein LWI28_000854 [Acer negundo]
MALHTASILPSTVSIYKEGKSNSSLKETGFFGVSLSSNLKAEFSSSLISKKYAEYGNSGNGSFTGGIVNYLGYHILNNPDDV